MIGNTGCGKTFLIKCLAKYLGVPLAIADATSLTEAGYVGDDVENILLKLYEKSEGNLEKTQQGIIYIDEIDKLALRGENTSLTRDVSGEGVQQALLKILEGTIARVPFGGGRKHPNAECVNIDTTNILFICGGAFDGLEKLINQDKKVNRTIGFGISTENISNEEDFTLENVQQHDLVRYGMMPEFIGRLPVITTLAPLTENDMVRILTEPKNAIVRQFQELFAMDDVKLQFEKDALMKIAAIANEKRIGARGLRSIVENVLQKTMFELPDMKSAKKVVVNAECVDGDSAIQCGYISDTSSEQVSKLVSVLSSLGVISSTTGETVGDVTEEVASSVDTMSDALDSAKEKQTNLIDALGNSRSATGLTKDDINNVTSAFKDLDNFDPASIFEETATGVHLNTQALKEYNEAVTGYCKYYSREIKRSTEFYKR